LHPTHGVEDGDASAEDGRILCGVDVVWDWNGGLGAKFAVLCI